MKKNTIIGLMFALALVVVGFVFYELGNESDSQEVQVPKAKLVKDGSGKFHWVETEENSDETIEESHPRTNHVDEMQDNDAPTHPETIIKKISKQCFICGGSAICKVCGGAGGRYNSYTQIYYPCTGCLGSGQCKYCGGTGTSEMVVTFYPDGSAVGIDTRTGQQYSNIPGVDNYLSDEEKSSLRDHNRKNNSDAIDMVDYNVPNYTGEDDKVYCEKCKKVTFRHTHRTVR